MSQGEKAEVMKNDPSDNRLRVMHLITGLGTGGAESMLAKLVERMDPEGFDSHVVSLLVPGPNAERIQAASVPVDHLGMRRGIPTPWAFGKLCRLLRAKKPHVLQTWLYHADLMGSAAAAVCGPRRVFWNIRCSNMDLGNYRFTTTMTLRINAKLSSFPEAVVSNSQTALDFHRSLGYAPRREVVIPNGFDTEVFAPDTAARTALRQSLGIAESAVVVGMIARFDPQKDHANLISAFGRMQRADVLLLCGDDMVEANAELVTLLDAAGVKEKVRLLGRRGDVPAVMNGLDVCVLSSAYGEGFPNVLGEAMACGVPCVTTDVGDAAHVVGETGKVVPPRDPEKLAAAVDELLSLPPEERIVLGRAARRRVEDLFSLDAVVQRYEALYR